MNNTLDLLLNMDVNKLKKPAKEVKIQRLSDIAGTDVIFEVEAITMNQFEYISEAAGDKSRDINSLVILEGTKSPNLKDNALMEKYSCNTPIELISKLLLPGEISKLYDEISKLSGFNADSVEEVKN